MAKSLFAVLAAVSALCAPASHAASPAVDSVIEVIQTGIASYYSHRFEGRRTASGDTFRNDALTAAHPHLPFGTIVRVTNLAKGHSVDVRITDRLPSKRAIIDLTRRAAAQLNMLQAGRVQVSLQVLEWGRNQSQVLRSASLVPVPPSAAAADIFSAVAAEVMVALSSEDSR